MTDLKSGKWKKIYLILFISLLVVLSAGCSSSNDQKSDNVASSPSTENGSSTLSVSSESTDTSSSDGSVPVIATNYNYSNFGQYPTVTLFGEKYLLIKPNDASKLAKLVLDSNDKYTIRTGETLDLGQGYTLEAKQVDVDGEKVWLQFNKDGQYIDDEIISVNNVSGGTWTVELDDIQGEDDVQVLKIHINQVFFGAVDGIAQIEGLWVIDYANTAILKIGDKLGHFTLVKINDGKSLVFEADGTQNNIQTAQPITSTSSTSDYQDAEWLKSISIQTELISYEINSLSTSAKNYDIDNLQKYGALLETDTKSALDESKSYSVSPDLQKVKEKYENALFDFNQAGYYAAIGASELQSEKFEQASQDIKTATAYMNSGGTSLSESLSLLDEYNKK